MPSDVLGVGSMYEQYPTYSYPICQNIYPSFPHYMHVSIYFSLLLACFHPYVNMAMSGYLAVSSTCCRMYLHMLLLSQMLCSLQHMFSSLLYHVRLNEERVFVLKSKHVWTDKHVYCHGNCVFVVVLSAFNKYITIPWSIAYTEQHFFTTSSQHCLYIHSLCVKRCSCCGESGGNTLFA